MSSLVTFSSPFFSSRAARSWSLIVLPRALSKPVTWVPWCGVAITFTKLRVMVSYPVPHWTATSTSSLRSTSVGFMWPRSSSTGIVSVNVPSPVSRMTSVIFALVARCSQNSPIPPAKRYSASSSPSATVSSRRAMARPGTR